ncbi:MAG: hypothetical protein OSA95_12015 [Opitutales bacterium]|nr:hypothetical protein [Opitutales bacterium]
MSNNLPKDTIGEHEGWLNNPLLTFFVGILLLCLFSILGNTFHITARGKSSSELDRDARFITINEWRHSNQIDLESPRILKLDKDGKPATYQIPLSEAKKLLILEHNPSSK